MKKITVLAGVLAAAFSLHAGLDGYFMLSLFSRGQIPSPSYSIYGARLSAIYGDCQELYGLDVGMAGTTQESAYGLQINALWSGVDADMAGAQIGLLNTVDGTMSGLQAGGFNYSGELAGCQLGIVNVSGDGAGFQLGVYNQAREYSGFQLGVFNVTRELHGCQLGVVNVITSDVVPFWILINAGW